MAPFPLCGKLMLQRQSCRRPSCAWDWLDLLDQPASRMSHSKQNVLWGRPTQCRLRFLQQGRLLAQKRHINTQIARLRSYILAGHECIPVWTQHPPRALPSCMSQLEAILSLHQTQLLKSGECRICCEAFPHRGSKVCHVLGHVHPSPI